LLSLQVAAPFDLYFLNDINPDVRPVLAERARRIGVAGAQVFELDLRAENALEHTRDIARVVVPWGPKIVVATGDANDAHRALKMLAPSGWRYICAVIDPEHAMYEWRALEELSFHEKAMDVLMLFPDEMDLGRGLAYYLRPGGGAKLDAYFPPGASWREVAQMHAHPPSALRRLYEAEMERMLDFKIGHPKTVSMGNRALYRLVFGSRAPLGIKIWNEICKKTRHEQYEFPFDV
jgi:three-Cys-motif partner protein